MTDAAHIPWLLLILREPLALAWLPDDIGPGFTARGDLFEAVSDDDLTGFYDRLHSQAGSLVGLQIAPLAIPDLPQRVAGLTYVRAVNAERQLQVFFDPQITNDVREITDQAFGGRTYRSLAGEFALSLDTCFLEEAERRRIAAAHAEWVTATPVGA